MEIKQLKNTKTKMKIHWTSSTVDCIWQKKKKESVSWKKVNRNNQYEKKGKTDQKKGVNTKAQETSKTVTKDLPFISLEFQRGERVGMKIYFKK